MADYSITFALILLTAPPSANECPHPMEATWGAVTRPAILLLATAEELCTLAEDAAHHRYLGYHDGAAIWEQGFSLACFQERYQRLRYAPRIVDADRFPSHPLAVEALAFNRAYHADLSRRLEMAPIFADELRELLAENDRLFAVWEACRNAATPQYGTVCRREALLTLRRLLGDEAYYRGVMPAPVPMWAMERR